MLQARQGTLTWLRYYDKEVPHRFDEAGQVERMNHTIKEATVQRYHYGTHEQLKQHLDDFVSAYNFGRRLKTLKGLTPYELICKQWTSEPVRTVSNTG
jgi:hypothetical protein